MSLETPSLLITDDNRAFRETLREVFEPRGFHTVAASDGAEALEIVQTEEIHLVLLDMHMPRLTGLELLQQLQRQEIVLPCILISAALDEAITRQAREAEAFSVLAKPVRFAEITHTVAQAMRVTYDWPS